MGFTEVTFSIFTTIPFGTSCEIPYKSISNDEIIDYLKQKIYEISETFVVTVLNIECDKDHFHMIFKQNLP